MKKTVLWLICLCITSSLLAELKYNEATSRFYTVPATNINQDEYHKLFLHTISNIGGDANNIKVYKTKQEFFVAVEKVITWLNVLGTSESLRLIADIEELIKGAMTHAADLENTIRTANDKARRAKSVK